MDISRVADIGTVNQITMTKSAEHRTETKTSTLAAEHTDSFVKAEATFNPAYTKKMTKKTDCRQQFGAAGRFGCSDRES